jgi:ATP-dependent RNA helicase DHX57
MDDIIIRGVEARSPVVVGDIIDAKNISLVDVLATGRKEGGEGRREGQREGGRRKEEGGRRKEEGGRRKEEGGRRKEKGGRRRKGNPNPP